ncbi:unnamed protein product [Urochloa humidicola]
MERQYSALTKLGFGALAFNSGLAIYRFWGDAGSVTFVLAAGTALVLLFLCLREYERGPGRDRIGIGRQYSALARMGFAVAACNSALASHGVRGGGGAASLAFVLLAFAALLALTWLFLRSFDGRAHGARR